MQDKNKEKYLTITVDVEEWFHSNWFDVDHIIYNYHDGVFPKSDVVSSINNIISMFDNFGIRATFFVLGGTAERYPSIVDSIKDSGHEIASHGYYHDWHGADTEIFRTHLHRFKKNVFSHPKGFRFPNYIFISNALNVLSEEGFLYDSSMVPSFNIPGWYGDPTEPLKPHVYSLEQNHGILEFPISVSPFLRFPGAGGWFLRNTSFMWTYYVIASQLMKNGYANIYFHNWEISSNNPSHNGIPFHVFRNTGVAMMKRIIRLISLCKKIDNVKIIPFEDLLDHEINETC